MEELLKKIFIKKTEFIQNVNKLNRNTITNYIAGRQELSIEQKLMILKASNTYIQELQKLHKKEYEIIFDEIGIDFE